MTHTRAMVFKLPWGSRSESPRSALEFILLNKMNSYVLAPRETNIICFVYQIYLLLQLHPSKWMFWSTMKLCSICRGNNGNSHHRPTRHTSGSCSMFRAVPVYSQHLWFHSDRGQSNCNQIYQYHSYLDINKCSLLHLLAGTVWDCSV
jgi:hypothetical protein